MRVGGSGVRLLELLQDNHDDTRADDAIRIHGAGLRQGAQPGARVADGRQAVTETKGSGLRRVGGTVHHSHHHWAEETKKADACSHTQGVLQDFQESFSVKLISAIARWKFR